MTDNVAITGAYGAIGSVLRNGLTDAGYAVTAIDIVDRAADDPQGVQLDLSAPRSSDDYARLVTVLEEQDAVIHLAWNIAEENFDTYGTAPENKWMTENVLEAAHDADVDTVIQGSSIHAAGLPAYAHENHMYGIDEENLPESKLKKTPEPYRSIIADRERFRDADELVSPYAKIPDSPYGETKLYHMEQLGRQYALETEGAPEQVVDARFGGVNETDRTALPEEPEYETIASSHQNTVYFVEQVLESEDPGYFKGYVMSDNDGCPYELGIPELGIHPVDRAENGRWSRKSFIRVEPDTAMYRAEQA